MKSSAILVGLLTTTVAVNGFITSKPHVRARPFSSGCAFRSSVSDDEKKETTWDRITGPKLFKTVTNWNGIHSVPLVPLRVLTGALMIHHGSEGS